MMGRNNKKRVLMASGLIVGSSVFMVAASTNKPEPHAFEFESHGLSIQRGEGLNPVVKTKAGGQVHQQQTTKVSLKGLGTRTLKGVVEDEPIASGGVQKATITDAGYGSTTVFSYTPATNSITISDGSSSVAVVRNADHSYSVDGQAAADGKAAVALLQDKPAYQSAKPHAIMLAYAYAHAPNAAAKNTQNCDLPGCVITGQAATPPAVCTLFDDFCECVACDKTGKGQACASCK